MNLFRHRDKPADWVIDSVIQYICSPIFSAPVLDFIEYRCVGECHVVRDCPNVFCLVKLTLNFSSIILTVITSVCSV